MTRISLTKFTTSSPIEIETDYVISLERIPTRDADYTRVELVTRTFQVLETPDEIHALEWEASGGNCPVCLAKVPEHVLHLGTPV